MSMTLARAAGALLSARGARARLAVFCYHQVLREKDPLRDSEPDVAEFQRDLEVIGRTFTVLALPEAVERIQAGTLPSRAACITFDDGYANNHEFAAPLLERAGLPATFYIAGNAVDMGIMFNDLIIEGVRIRGHEWILDDLDELGVAIEGTEDSLALISQILQRLKYIPPRLRSRLAESFFRTNTRAEPPRLMMDRANVTDLASRGFDIGGHTLHHPILKELSDAEAREEIAGCYRWIAEVTGRAPVSFAYPNGIPGRDFGPQHSKMVMEAGFHSAVTTHWAVATPHCNPYCIPRLGPWWRLGTSMMTGFVKTYGKSWVTRCPSAAPP